MKIPINPDFRNKIGMWDHVIIILSLCDKKLLIWVYSLGASSLINIKTQFKLFSLTSTTCSIAIARARVVLIISWIAKIYILFYSLWSSIIMRPCRPFISIQRCTMYYYNDTYTARVPCHLKIIVIFWFLFLRKIWVCWKINRNRVRVYGFRIKGR